MKDQTLDQQCTVTRPGVAPIASALLVELFISILQHPQGAAAPAPASRSEEYGNHPLGLLPHQIRGFLSTFDNITVAGRSYKCCSACSDNIIDAYKKEGWEFIQRALNETGYVEELSGLKEVSSPSLFDIQSLHSFHYHITSLSTMLTLNRFKRQQKRLSMILNGMKLLIQMNSLRRCR